MARKGENIHKRKDGRWEGRYISSRYPNGTAKYSSVYGKSYNEVKARLIEEKAKIANGCRMDIKNMLFADVLQLWLKSNSPKLKNSTLIKYSNLIEKHIMPELGGKYVSALDAVTLNVYADKKLKDGRLDKSGGLSASYTRTIMLIIKSALDFAVCENLCLSVSKNFHIPKPQKQKIDILSHQDQEKLEQYLFSNINHSTAGIIIALYTGMRLGEICALRWQNVDLKRRIIYVDSSTSRVSVNNITQFEICSPKTASSQREIPIPLKIIPFLNIAKNQSKSSYVISDKENFVNPRTFEYRFHNIVQKSKIDDFNFHRLRHTFATRCVEKNVDIKTISEILGHSDISVTLNLYIHSSMEQKMKQIDKLNKQIA